VLGVGDVWQLTGVSSATSFWPSKWMMQNNVYRADSSLHKIGDGRIFSILLVHNQRQRILIEVIKKMMQNNDAKLSNVLEQAHTFA
jgi:hypothetical protein